MWNETASISGSESSQFTREVQVRFLQVYVQVVPELKACSKQILVTVCHHVLMVGKLSSSGEGSQTVKEATEKFPFIFVNWSGSSDCP